MGNKVKVNIFLIVILLIVWSTATDASSNVMLRNLKSFGAGGVGGKRKLFISEAEVNLLVTLTLHSRFQGS
jgi:hypothetical protein